MRTGVRSPPSLHTALTRFKSKCRIKLKNSQSLEKNTKHRKSVMEFTNLFTIYIQLSIYIDTYLSICVQFSIFWYLFIYMCMRLSLCLSIYLFTYLSSFLFICLSKLSICLLILLSVYNCP